MILMKCETQLLSSPDESLQIWTLMFSFTYSSKLVPVCFGLFVCFKTPIFFSILWPHMRVFSPSRDFEYAQILINSRSFSQDFIKFQVEVSIFMSLGYDQHSTINTRFFQYLLKIQNLMCLEKRDSRGWWCLKPRKLNVIFNSAKLQLLIKFLWERTLVEIKMHIRILISQKYL